MSFIGKNKKTLRKMFSETKFTERDSSKNRLALVKTNRVSKFMLSVQKLCCSYYEYKGSSKKYCPVIILVMPSKNESIPNIKENQK